MITKASATKTITEEENVANLDKQAVERAPVKGTISSKFFAEPIEVAPANSFLAYVAPRWLLFLAAGLLLGSATFDTLATKFMNRQELPICEGCESKLFEAPLFQTWVGYIGHDYLAKRANRRRVFDFTRSPLDYQKPSCPRWIWIFPLLLDFTYTSCLNYATVLTQASTVQMLRSFNIIVAFFLSAFILENRLYTHQALGVFLTLAGGILVGVHAMLNPESATNHGNLQWVGIVLALSGTFISALQWTLEETIFRHYFSSPLEAVGLMGLYGVILGGVVLIVAHFAGLENLSGAFYQMTLGEPESTNLILFNFLYMFSLAINTASGITVTKLSSSLLRTIINAGRTVSVWAMELILRWDSFAWLNFCGLILIVAAIFIYNYNYLTSKERHWFGDKSLRSSIYCLPNKNEVTHDSILVGNADLAKSSSDLSAQALRRRKLFRFAAKQKTEQEQNPAINIIKVESEAHGGDRNAHAEP